jgi:hypothetical protein
MRLKAHQTQELDKMIETDDGLQNVRTIVRRALRLAGKPKMLSMKSTEHLLDELDRVMTAHYNHLPQRVRDNSSGPPHNETHGWCDTIPEDYYRPVP